MKKKSMQQIPVVELSFQINKPNEEDKRAWLLVEAQCVTVDGSKVLVLELYEKDKSLLCRHFISKEDTYYTLFMKTTEFMYNKIHKKAEWSTIKYETILKRGDCYYGYTGDKAIYSKEAVKAIREFEGENKWQNQNITYSISSIENDISREKSWTAQERKQARIDQLMSEVEPMDETFYNWLKQEVFPNRYIFAETRPLKRGYRCRCTACGSTFLSKEKPKHNEIMECKKCHGQAMIKTRVNHMTEKNKILVAQPYDDTTWVLRHFKVIAQQDYLFKKASIRLQVFEKVRMFLTPGKRTKIYYGVYHEANEQKQKWGTQKGSIMVDKNFMMYPGRVSDITEGQANLHMIGTIQYAASMKKEMNYNEVIRSWEDKPFLEYLIKGKYFHLANELLSWYNSELIDTKSETINDLLKLDAQRSYRLRELNGGKNVLKLLQEEKITGCKVSQENLLFVNQNNIYLDSMERERTGLNVNQTLNYYHRQMERNTMAYTTFANYYRDYLTMAAERGMDLTDDIVRRNPRMMEFHNQYLEEKNKEADDKRRKSLNRKFPDIKKDYRKNCVAFAWDNKEYIILVPKDAGEIIDEGRIQHHCVGASDLYMDRMNKGESYILFLRRKEQPEIPYYTLEVKEDRIVQKYAAYDRQPDIQEVNKVLAEWMHEVKKRRKKAEVKVMIEQPAQSVRLAVAAGQ